MNKLQFYFLQMDTKMQYIHYHIALLLEFQLKNSSSIYQYLL